MNYVTKKKIENKKSKIDPKSKKKGEKKRKKEGKQGDEIVYYKAEAHCNHK